MSPTPTEQDRLTSDLTANLIVLARNAAANVDPADPVDYWYRLGQRNAYAHATGMLLAPDLGQGAFRIAERLTAALDAKESRTSPDSARRHTGSVSATARPRGWSGSDHAPSRLAMGRCPASTTTTASGGGSGTTSGSRCGSRTVTTSACSTRTTRPGTSTPS